MPNYLNVTPHALSVDIAKNTRWKNYVENVHAKGRRKRRDEEEKHGKVYYDRIAKTIADYSVKFLLFSMLELRFTIKLKSYTTTFVQNKSLLKIKEGKNKKFNDKYDTT